MKFNESPEQKKMRLKRCLNALKQADIGKPSAFVGMKVGQAIDIEWNREHENIVVDADDEDSAAVEIQNKGKRIQDDDGFWYRKKQCRHFKVLRESVDCIDR